MRKKGLTMCLSGPICQDLESISLVYELDFNI